MRLAQLVLLLTLQIFLSGNCQAHGFGQRYDLPLPLWLYLSGAALTVALSFSFLVRQKHDMAASAHRQYGTTIHLRPPCTGIFLLLLRLLVLALYLMVIAVANTTVRRPPAYRWRLATAIQNNEILIPVD